jgi:hypothetical protein
MRMPEARDPRGTRSPITEYIAFGVGDDLMYSGKLPYWRMLISARVALLIFPVLTLLFTYRLGRWIASPAVGAAAAVFLSFDPTFLGHSSWVGTDSAGAAGFVAGVYYGLRFFARPSWSRAMVFAVVLGLAISCKYSCVLLIPVLAVDAGLRARWRWSAPPKPLPRLVQLAAIAGVALVVLWATFLFDVGPMRIQAMFKDEPIWTRLPAAVIETPVPMPSLWLGYLFLITRSAHGHPTYLNGAVSFRGWWYYFPEALLVKQSLAFLTASAIAIVLLFLRRRWTLRSTLLLAPCALYLAIGMSSHYQLGIRHLLPILPLMYVFVAMQPLRARWQALLAALVLIGGIETAWIHPDYVAYFNAAVGGPAHGERYLIDSNLDWGQDVNRLAEWLKTAPEAKGRAYSMRVFGASGDLLKTLGLDPAAADAKPHGLFAISKNFSHRLFNAERLDGGRGVQLGDDYTWVTKYPRVKRIGYSIDVYDLDQKPTTDEHR